MHTDFFNFAVQWLRVAAMALIPVVLTAFLTIPWNLGGHPAEPVSQLTSGERHMT